MTKQPPNTHKFLEVPLEQLTDNYARLRLIHPRSEEHILSSIRQFGQISPIIVNQVDNRSYEIVDGFKRYRALKKIGKEKLEVKLLNLGRHASKASIISMNWDVRSIGDLEEGLVLTSLYREDQLSQKEISILVGRHKSWVCRRISLIERLSHEVLEAIKIGVINTTIARELAKLPHGNQAMALNTVITDNLTSRETASLVSALRKSPTHRHKDILNSLKDNRLEQSPETGTANFPQDKRPESGTGKFPQDNINTSSFVPKKEVHPQVDIFIKMLCVLEKRLVQIQNHMEIMDEIQLSQTHQHIIELVFLKGTHLFKKIKQTFKITV